MQRGVYRYRLSLLFLMPLLPRLLSCYMTCMFQFLPTSAYLKVCLFYSHNEFIPLLLSLIGQIGMQNRLRRNRETGCVKFAQEGRERENPQGILLCAKLPKQTITNNLTTRSNK